MKHKLLTTATLLLFVLLTWSCTSDDELAMTPPPAIATPDASALSITIAPRPQFAIGSTQPATRAIQTPDGTAAEWEANDVLWLYVHFSWIPSGKTEADREYKNYVSALRYKGTEWRQLSEEDCTELNTASITPYTEPNPNFSKEYSYLGFVSNPRWPAEAFAEGVTDAKVWVGAYYLGKGVPNENGILSLDYTTDCMLASTTALIGTPVNLNLEHGYSRLHITDKATLECANVWYIHTWNLSSGNLDTQNSFELTVPKGGSYYFVEIQSNSELTLDGTLYTLTPGRTDESGNKFYYGYTYTLVPLKNGTVTPGEVDPADL